MTKHTIHLDDEQLSTVIEALRTEHKMESNGGAHQEEIDHIEDVLNHISGATEPAPKPDPVCKLCGAETPCELCVVNIDGGLNVDIELASDPKLDTCSCGDVICDKGETHCSKCTAAFTWHGDDVRELHSPLCPICDNEAWTPGTECKCCRIVSPAPETDPRCSKCNVPASLVVRCHNVDCPR